MSDPSGPEAAANRFADLRVRVTSSLVLLLVGGLAVWAGGRVFEAVVLLIALAMTWELARLGNGERPGQALVIGLATAAAVAGAAERPWAPELAVLALGPALFLITPRRDRLLAAFWTLLVELACLGLIEARAAGPLAVLWLLGVVILSDVCGYFAGRALGGPRFWPAISPKKTWSGTVAGWFGALAWTLALSPWMKADPWWGILVLAPVFALAGQVSDILESWIKRRAGVKDASTLIPGHGGVMDRFDSVAGAAALGMALEWLRAGLGG